MGGAGDIPDGGAQVRDVAKRLRAGEGSAVGTGMPSLGRGLEQVTGDDLNDLCKAALLCDDVKLSHTCLFEFLVSACNAGCEVATPQVHAYAVAKYKEDQAAAVSFWCACLAKDNPRTNDNSLLMAAAMGMLLQPCAAGYTTKIAPSHL